LKKNASVKVLVIDKLARYREIFRLALVSLEGVEVAGMASDESSAIARIKDLKPDLGVLDFDIAESGTAVLIGKLKNINPDLEIILVSGKHRTSATSSVKALDMGAMYFVRKPEGNSSTEDVAFFRKYFEPVINLFRVHRMSVNINRAASFRYDNLSSRRIINGGGRIKIPDRFDILAVGSSLGGPEALGRFIPRLPANFPIPVVVAQHMPTGFTTMMSTNLDNKSRLIVKEAQSGDNIRPGHVYVAPGGKHLKIVPGAPGIYQAAISDTRAVNGCKPSVDVLFLSLAKNFNGNILAVILTGMGSDGLVGVRTMKQMNKCFCITQDEQSCVVYGMPAMIDNAGLSDLSLPIDKISDSVVRLVSKKSVPVK